MPTSTAQTCAALPVYQRNVKPTDPRLAKYSRPLHTSMPQSLSSAAQPAKHDKAGASSCIPQPPCSAAQPAEHDKAEAACCKDASGRDAGGSAQMGSELEEEVGETGLQAPSSAASSNLPCKHTVTVSYGSLGRVSAVCSFKPPQRCRVLAACHMSILSLPILEK